VILAGVDYGRVRIGLAATTEGGLVFPVAVIKERSRLASVAALASRISDLSAERVIVGLPLNFDGTAGPQALAAERFAQELRQTIMVPVEMYDERLTSFEARERLKDVPRKKKRPAVDAIAACVILEAWLQSNQR
jgi:putative Holliday junction resolvase